MKDLMEKWRNASTPEEKAKTQEEMLALARSQSPDKAMNAIKAVDNRLSEIEEVIELGDIADMASMSYIAKKYFNKSRSWLCQRLNGNMIHGKPARLTEEERQTLAHALDDMSKQFKEKSLSIING